MFRSILAALVVALTALASGCTSVPMATPEADMAAKQFQPDPDKATIYIYRNETFGAALKMSVALDGQLIGDTASKTYLMRKVAPGQHTLLSKGESDSTVFVNAKPGANYFVWQEIKMGMFQGRSELHLVDEATGRAGVQECKLIQ